MRRFLTGIGSLLTLVALLVGIPVALIALAGNPFPPASEWAALLTTPDYAGGFLIGTVLPLVAWIAWLTFAIAFVLELPAQVRGIEAPHIGPLRLQRQGAAVLIGAVLVMFAGGLGGAMGSPDGAQAATPDAPVVSASQSIDGTQAPAIDASSEAAPEEASAPAVELPTHTVKDGESLWRIAEQHLGDGKRYTEIAQLNYGAQQADGHALTSDHWLNSGWVLQLPADAAVAATPNETQHTVAAGENLWQIAESTLGDGDRYMELFDANQGKQQPNGQALTDPQVLQPGWVLDIPGTDVLPTSAPAAVSAAPAAPANEAPVAAEPSDVAPVDEAAPVEDAAPAAPSPEATPTETAAPSTTPTDEASSNADAVDETEDDDASWVDELFASPLTTPGGIGGVLAAGLLSVLGIRRLKQLRNRRPGQRISMPAEDLTTMELELRAVENPMGVDDVDHALRHLAVWAQDSGATLPQLYAIRLAESEIALYLDAPSDLPAPFVAVTEDKQAWVVNPNDLPELDRIPSAPYPALVALGHDETDAQILVDLEHMGALNLIGDPDATRGALTALALELADSRWADDLQITLVGIAEGLPRALDTGRVRHVDDVETLLRNLRGQAAETEQALEEMNVGSIEQARSLNAQAEAWTPEIVILGEIPAEAARQELAELVTRVPRVGIATVSNGHLVGDWTLEVAQDRTAVLQPLGLPIKPQTVTDAEYSKILALFDVTDHASVEGPTHLEQTEVDVDSLPAAIAAAPETLAAVTVPQDAPEDDQDWKGTLHKVLAPSGAQTPAASPAAAQAAVEAPEAPESHHEPATVAEDSPEPEAAVVEHPAVTQLHQAPYVRLLGNVEVLGARGDEPRTAQTSYVRQSTELIAFLALHPVSNATQVSEALWPGKDPQGKAAESRRNGLMSRARRWLGNDDDGARYIPPVGNGGYRVEGVTTDWAVWRELVGDDVSETSTADLVAALQLVEAQPLAGVKEKSYGWAERERMEMIAAIGDAAHELAARSLKAGDFTNARLAAAVGRQVDPINEVYWRDAIKAEYQAGDAQGVDRIVAQHANFLDSFEDGYEPEDETTQLIQQIRDRQTVNN